ncbi:hypothetical protein SAMN04487894_113113 [Niabella drilacis]|uniref:Uncharacterized protein n=1 Tax=Niabella drilacis (strain DSM 25811 / CCM 8410 / CCUG 62505 / LMG 26954 / E90) TaxID=1285928 RepID=A0A1G6XN47_NIADE|nr:hypothetical protein SAMN04487894_113113 [Niabella drilacis]
MLHAASQPRFKKIYRVVLPGLRPLKTYRTGPVFKTDKEVYRNHNCAQGRASPIFSSIKRAGGP